MDLHCLLNYFTKTHKRFLNSENSRKLFIFKFQLKPVGKMSHEYMMIIRMCCYLYDKKFTSIRYEHTNDKFQNSVIMRAILLHAKGNKAFADKEPENLKKVKNMIDTINIHFFIKNHRDKARYNL